MLLLFYRYNFFLRSLNLWLKPLYKSDPPPKSPSSGGGLWSLRSEGEGLTEVGLILFLPFYRYNFFLRSLNLWLTPLFKSDPPPKSPASGRGLWSLRSEGEGLTEIGLILFLPFYRYNFSLRSHCLWLRHYLILLLATHKIFGKLLQISRTLNGDIQCRKD